MDVAVRWLIVILGSGALACATLLLTRRIVAGAAASNAALHWTERARREWPARRGVSRAISIVPLVIALCVYGWTKNVLFACITAYTASWLLFGTALTIARGDQLRWDDAWLASRHRMVEQAPLVLIAVAACLCTREFGVRTVLVLLLTAFGLLALAHDSQIGLHRVLGLYTDAGKDLLGASVSRVATRLGTRPPRAYVLAYARAQATAHPGVGCIAVSLGMLKLLPSDELDAVVAHEIGHLDASKLRRALGLASVLPLVLVAAYQPMQIYVTAMQFAGICAVAIYVPSFVAAAFGDMRAHSEEERADAVANAHFAASHARALERVYKSHGVPAVLHVEDSPRHPNLYDRMVASGTTPSFKRPEPPSTNLQSVVWVPPALVAFAFLATMQALGILR